MVETDTHLEVYDYPGRYDDPEQGQIRAQVRRKRPRIGIYSSRP